MNLTSEQRHILICMEAGKVLERTCQDGRLVVPAYRLGGAAVSADAVMQLEAWGYVQPMMPDVLLRIGYSPYELCPAGAAAV